MSQTKRQKIGERGEDLACLFLKKHGFSILERNYVKRYGEIDIISQKDNILHFVEVKTVVRDNVPRETSLSNDYYEPEDNVHFWKRKRLARVIQVYLLEKGISDDFDWQIDLISIYLDKDGQELKSEFIENITL